MSESTTLFVTPPFTQLNTPYPATAYLKGFFNRQQLSAYQADLGIEVILKLFCKEGLMRLFERIEENNTVEYSENALRIIHLQTYYINTIDPVIAYLQDQNPTLAYRICERGYLPEAQRFDQIEELDWAFGTMGIRDKARHFATLYLEDLSDLIQECIDPYFGFSRYAERLGRSASSFDELYKVLTSPITFIDELLIECLDSYLQNNSIKLVAVSVPFPGNLYSAFRIANHIKSNYPTVYTVLGGGFPNTELRSVSDKRVFDYFDFITLDDGERPLLCLIDYLEGKRNKKILKRTFALNEEQEVTYYNGALERDIPFNETGTPDYQGLPIKSYLSVIEITNPMHRLWSDGRWNKLTLAHGCYWKKCSFCDISLDYIGRYVPATASLICDRIEELINNTGENGFHFVDEAAPPALMRDVALEILRRNINIVWWTNIRFEQNFTADLCRLLKASGCIGVSGGLEVASDRLLELMKKGVTVAQVARVADHFTQAGMMVHAYLMYGFPTQTAQETVDSLEMVRQLFMHGVLQSGFWHRFAMTSHSPVGLNPAAFGVKKTGPVFAGFADNDCEHEDEQGADHALFSEGLKKSLFNYMHGTCFDFELQEWFDFPIPKSKVNFDYIQQALDENNIEKPIQLHTHLRWLGTLPSITYKEEIEDGECYQVAIFTFYTQTTDFGFEIDAAIGDWLFELLEKISVHNSELITIGAVKEEFESLALATFEDLMYSEPWNVLRENGLLYL